MFANPLLLAIFGDGSEAAEQVEEIRMAIAKDWALLGTVVGLLVIATLCWAAGKHQSR